MSGKILTEMAFDEIVHALPSVHHRANLVVHNVMLNQRIKELEEQIRGLGGPTKAVDIAKKTESTIEVTQLRQQLQEANQRLTEIQNAENDAKLKLEGATRHLAVIEAATKTLSSDKRSVEAEKTVLENEKKGLLETIAKLTEAQVIERRELSNAQLKIAELERKLAASQQDQSTKGLTESIRMRTRDQIVAWLRAVNQGDTVRALYGKKMATMIEKDEFDKVP